MDVPQSTRSPSSLPPTNVRIQLPKLSLYATMPKATPKSSMSPGELATCEDFLDGNREFAIDLLSSVESICQWHTTDDCPETCAGRTCTLCELCSADGLMGATQKALASYDDAEKHIKAVRASLGKNALPRGGFSLVSLVAVTHYPL